MKALEVRTIFTPYYLHQIEHDIKVVAFSYRLNLDRVRGVELVRIIDKSSNRVRVEPG